MTLQIVPVETEGQMTLARELFREYLAWVASTLYEEYQIRYETRTSLDPSEAELAKFAPPTGRLLLALVDGQPAGVGALRKLDAATCEIKRFYVRPSFRGQHIGRAMIDQLIDQARAIGYQGIRLDSTGYMTAAHALYRSVGFEFVDPYPGNSVPPEFQPHWVFMELNL